MTIVPVRLGNEIVLSNCVVCVKSPFIVVRFGNEILVRAGIRFVVIPPPKVVTFEEMLVINGNVLRV